MDFISFISLPVFPLVIVLVFLLLKAKKEVTNLLDESIKVDFTIKTTKEDLDSAKEKILILEESITELGKHQGIVDVEKIINKIRRKIAEEQKQAAVAIITQAKKETEAQLDKYSDDNETEEALFYQQTSDPPEEQYWDNTGYVAVSADLDIEYTSASGKPTRRSIEIAYYDGSRYLKGYCLLRNDYRTFRIDRIDSCVDRETGEVIEDVPAYLRDKFETSQR